MEDYSPTNAGYGAVARLEKLPTPVYSLWGTAPTAAKAKPAAVAACTLAAPAAAAADAAVGGAAAAAAPAPKRRMRRKVILLMAYSGTGYVVSREEKNLSRSSLTRKEL